MSEGAVRGLVTGAADAEVLNRLLNIKISQHLINLIRIYFQDTAAKGVMTRNQLIEMAISSLSDLMKDIPLMMVTVLVAEQLEKAMLPDGETSGQFRQLIKKMIGQAGLVKTQYIPRILSCLQGADLSKHKDSSAR